MKKGLLSIGLAGLLLNTSIQAAPSKYYDYKVSLTSKAAVTLTIAGIASFGLPWAYNKTIGFQGQTAVVGILGSLATGAVTSLSGVIVGLIATYQGLETVDKKKVLKEYKRLKSFNRSAIYAGEISADGSYQKLLKRFSCVECSTDLEKVRKLVSLMDHLEETAVMIVGDENFDKSKLEEVIEGKKVGKAIVRILDKDATKENISIALKLFSLALINELD